MGSYYIFLGQLSGMVSFCIGITKRFQNVAYLQFTGPRDKPDPKCILIYFEDVTVNCLLKHYFNNKCSIH